MMFEVEGMNSPGGSGATEVLGQAGGLGADGGQGADELAFLAHLAQLFSFIQKIDLEG